MRTLVAVGVIATGVMLSAQGTAPRTTTDTRAALVNRVDEAGLTVGIAVGTLTPEGRTFDAYGGISKGGPAPTAETMFEIGSITKVFTALLLADMVERGEVALDDPVERYLPDTVKVPASNDRRITLGDLVTHSSGLPRIPTNIEVGSLENPYASYDAQKLYAFLSGYTLTRDPGAAFEYSNLGAGLLGHVLSRRAGLSYEQLVQRRILEPLKMTSTTITLSDRHRALMATPHDSGLTAVRVWDFDVLAGAGAIRSSVSDMLTFADAHLEMTDSPLKAAMERMRTFRRPGPSVTIEQAMGWLVMKPLGREVFAHDGGTAGFRTALMIDPTNKRASMVWANAPIEVTDIAAHAVEPKAPMPLYARQTSVQLPALILDSYVGVYELAPNVTMTITREDTRMFTQLTGQGKIEIFAEKEDEFMLRVVPARISFEKDPTGAVNSAVLRQAGQNTPAKKIR